MPGFTPESENLRSEFQEDPDVRKVQLLGAPDEDLEAEAFFAVIPIATENGTSFRIVTDTVDENTTILHYFSKLSKINPPPEYYEEVDPALLQTSAEVYERQLIREAPLAMMIFGRNLSSDEDVVTMFFVDRLPTRTIFNLLTVIGKDYFHKQTASQN